MRLSEFVYISFYQALNLGDDLFLKVLLERYPNEKFLIYDIASYKKIFPEYENVIFVHPISLRILSLFARKIHLKKFTAQNVLASRCKITIMIGGSIFSTPQTLEFRNDLISKRRCLILGSNLGSNMDTYFKEGCKAFFESKEDVCFRDFASYNMFSELPNVRVAPDILWTLKMPYVEGRGLFVSVMCSEKSHPELAMFQKVYSDIVVRLVREEVLHNKRVVLGSFCMKEGDEVAIQNVLNALTVQERRFVEVYCYCGDIEATLNIINSCERVFATRFHSVVLGLLMGKRVIPICYSNKTENLLDDLGLGDRKNLISELRYEHLKECSLSRKEIECLSKKAEAQFQMLDAYLCKEEKEACVVN